MKYLPLTLILTANSTLFAQQNELEKRQNAEYVRMVETLNDTSNKKKERTSSIEIFDETKKKKLIKDRHKFLEELGKKPIVNYSGEYSPAPVVGGGESQRVDLGENVDNDLIKGMSPADNPQYYIQERRKERTQRYIFIGLGLITILLIIRFTVKKIRQSIIIPVITNAYAPYEEKFIERNIDASIINIAYNGCHRLVAHTLHTSITFRQKTCLETMLFLIAVELQHISSVKNKEITSLMITTAMSLSQSIKDELKSEILNIYPDHNSFIMERIEIYINVLTNLNEDSELMLMVLMLEKPFTPIRRTLNYEDNFEYSINIDHSKIASALPKYLQMLSILSQETIEARESIDKIYKQ